jgi:hypothetical protein
MKKRIRTLIIILLQTFMLVRLSAQTSHTISGIVKDKEAAPISGVSIQVSWLRRMRTLFSVFW